MIPQTREQESARLAPVLPPTDACDYIGDMLEGLRDVAQMAGLRDLAGVLELAGVAADRTRDAQG